MPRSKRQSKLRRKPPARRKKAAPKQSAPAALNRPEIWGLGLVALGLFLGSVLYAGWNGGYVGGALVDGLRAIVGGLLLSGASLGAILRRSHHQVRRAATATRARRSREPVDSFTSFHE